MTIRTIYWENDAVVMIDQKALPAEERYVTCHEYGQVIDAIDDLTIRGAPAIGIAAAMGIALGMLHDNADSEDALDISFEAICHRFSQSRPTARNLFWAIERMRHFYKAIRMSPPEGKRGRKPRRADQLKQAQQISLFEDLDSDHRGGNAMEVSGVQRVKKALVDEAIRMAGEDISINRQIGSHGKTLIKDGDRILTHCNAGALATAG